MNTADTSMFSALIGQVVNSPSSLLIIAALSIVAYLLEIWPKFPSAYIPHIIVGLGMFAYPFFASRGSVPETFPNPVMVLVANGLISGFVATVVHVSLIAWLLKRFGAKPATEPEAKP